MASGTTPHGSPEILIVGAGPSGLILALSLLRNGVPVRIIEKSTTNRIGQRGAGLSPRSLEVFESLGVLPEIIKRAIDIPMFQMYKMPEGVETLKEFAPAPHLNPTPDRPYPNSVLFGQDGLDMVLRSEIAKFGCAVELGAELQSLEQTQDHVYVQILHHSLDATNADNALDPTKEDASYKWVIGADGGRGVVRKQVGMTFIGEMTEMSFVVGDIRLENDLPYQFNHWGQPNDIVTVIRPTDTPGVWSFVLGGAKIANTAEVSASEQSLKDYIRASTGGREDIKITHIVWKSPYRVNIRMVDTFQKGRVFVTGDAGHIHSPAGGQGLNTGVQDSYNLGWKLALVAKGLAPPLLLETYNKERFPVVAEMLNVTTDLMKKTFSNFNNEKGWKRSGDLDQLGVNYRGSSILVDEVEATQKEATQKGSSYSILAGGHVQPGDRAPDASGLYNISKGLTEGIPTRLFKLLNPSRHDILIFADRIEPKDILAGLQRYKTALVRPIIIAKAGMGSEADAENVFEDRDGYAHDAYKGPEGYSGVFVVRPDGMIGARLNSLDALERYFLGIFGKHMDS